MFSMPRGARFIVLPLIAGAAATVAIAWLCAIFVDLSKVSSVGQYSVVDGSVHWTVNVLRGWTGVRLMSRRELGVAWSTEQATGPPDTPLVGDHRTAWASQNPDDIDEWLELTYAAPLEPRGIHIYESFNPGALTKVTVFDELGTEIVVWEGVDPTILAAGGATPVFKLPLAQKVRTQRVKLYIASGRVPGWNEIDAVGLLDASGAMHWAKGARASSSYGSRMGQPISQVRPVVPSWSGLRQPGEAFAAGNVKVEDRWVEGRGWPLPAMSAQMNNLAGAQQFKLPLRPIWFGLAVDTVVLGAMIAALGWLLTRPARLIVEGARARQGCCPRCAYDLRFDLAAGCPECGWRR
jgi:hypothetical protein